MPVNDSLKIGGLPIGLASNVKLKRNIPEGRQIGWADVDIDETTEAYRIRREKDHFTRPTANFGAVTKALSAEIADDLFHRRNVPIDTHRQLSSPYKVQSLTGKIDLTAHRKAEDFSRSRGTGLCCSKTAARPRITAPIA